MKKIKVKKGEILQHKGEINTKVYLVEKGLLRCYSLDTKGKEHIYMFGPENWIVTDNCEANVPCELFIDALEDSEILVSNKEFEDVKLDTKLIMKRLETLQKRIIMLMSSTAIERYEHFIKTYPDIIQRVPQKMIASYLGITPEALSKVKGDQFRKK